MGDVVECSGFLGAATVSARSQYKLSCNILYFYWRIVGGSLSYYSYYYLPLKEMLFRKGLGVLIHVVLRLASYRDVAVLYLVLPPCNMSLWN